MNAKKKRRLAFAAALIAVGAVLALIVVYGLGQNTMYFRSPSDVAAKQVAEGVSFRLGGLVQQGSIAINDPATSNTATISSVGTSNRVKSPEADGRDRRRPAVARTCGTPCLVPQHTHPSSSRKILAIHCSSVTSAPCPVLAIPL